MRTLQEIIGRYKRNMDRQQELDAALQVDQGRMEWRETLQQRAVEVHEMYLENGQLIEELEELLSLPLTDESAEEFYREAHSMYWDGYDDCQILLPILKKLMEHYEARQDVEHLLFLYGATFYEESEIQSRREGGEFKVDYNLKIIALQSEYTKLPTAELRKRIWGAYYNTVVSGLGNRAVDIDTSYHYLERALALWNDPSVQALDGGNEEIADIVRRLVNEWMAAEEYIEDSTSETKENFCRLACETYRRERQENGDDINSEVYAAYLHARVLQGDSTFDEIIDEYLAYYMEKATQCPSAEEMTDEDRYFIINTPLTLERWLGYGISDEKARRVISVLKTFTQETWYHKLDKCAAPFLNEILAQWCFKLVKYLDTQQEKEDWVFQLLVRRQLPTYLHSVMVAHLADALCKEVLRSRPELLEGVADLTLDDIPGFVRRCALLHDVGKTRITDIVNTQGRKLWDREFRAIRFHPQYGAAIVECSKDLAKYHDVIIGHHRFYDGSGGYPMEFDNTKSPYRIIIDLITICDCIDAATDHLGRNYKRAKSMDAIMEELVAGKNTRYNGDLVEIIENSLRLRRELNYIVSDGRLDSMYRAYLGSAEL